MKQIFLLCATALFIGYAPAQAQTGTGWDPTGLQLTRAELEEMLERYELTAGDAVYSGALRSQARAEADLIRQRLQDGDIRAGDRVALVVEGFLELSDTFNVGANRSIVLPEIGEISLTGVLRSELQPHMAARIGRFINNPVVHARSLVRLQVLGAVRLPGFYTIPSDVLVDDALMLAGGPLPGAQLHKITIERGTERIWSEERMREAILEGRTLDQLSIRAGDGIMVPQSNSRVDLIRNGALIITALASLFALSTQIGIF